MTLRRIETRWGHKYTLDGKPVPGVTTLINKGLPKPALVRWAAKAAAEYAADNLDAILALPDREGRVNLIKGAPWAERDRKAARGTEVHNLAEQLIHGVEVEVPEHLFGHVEAYVRFLDEWGVEPVIVERPLANRKWWYAGTLDLVADIGGTRWLLDIKTASGVYGDNALQVDAYRHADFYLDGDGSEQPMPDGIERLGIIHVRADGYDLVPLDSSGQAFKDFLHVAWVGKAEDRIRTYVADPIYPEPENTSHDRT